MQKITYLLLEISKNIYQLKNNDRIKNILDTKKINKRKGYSKLKKYTNAI